jgi:hypothetical protein
VLDQYRPAGLFSVNEPAGLIWSVVTESPKCPARELPDGSAAAVGCMRKLSKNGGLAM